MADLQLSQLMQAAMRQYRGDDLAGAAATCGQILAKSRKHAEALGLLGNIAQRRGLHEEAVRHFKQCVALRPKAPMAHVMLGHALHRLGRYGEALDRFDKALKLEPGLPAALAGKADVHLTRGQYDRVESLLGPAVKSPAACPELAVILAEAALHRRALDDAITIAEAARAAPDLGPGLRYRLGSVLGKALERRGDHDAAFDAYRWGNEGAGAAAFDTALHGRRIDELITVFAPANFERLPRGQVDASRAIFVVGMPRCGSTLVERILDAHPAVHGAGETGLVFELIGSLSLAIGSTLPYPACAADLDQADVDRLATSHLDALRTLARRAEHVVDKNLQNYLHLGLIAVLMPTAKIIHCRRDPLDTCFSIYAEPLAPAVHPYATDLAAIGAVHRDYERLMAHWRSLPGLDMLEVDYETIVAEPEAATRRLLEHCDLPWDDACLRFHETGRSALTLSHAQVRQPIYRTAVRRASPFAAHLGPLREALASG